MDIYEGKIDVEQVNDSGYYDNDYQLCLDYKNVESIFRKYKGKKVKIAVEILQEETDEDENNE